MNDLLKFWEDADNSNTVELKREGGFINLEKTVINIGGNDYIVSLAHTQEEREKGLSELKTLAKNEGMLFIYPDVVNKVSYTMKDTSLDLDIIFIDEDNRVVSVHHCNAHQKEDIEETFILKVLEINKGSNIEKGDKLYMKESPSILVVVTEQSETPKSDLLDTLLSSFSDFESKLTEEFLNSDNEKKEEDDDEDEELSESDKNSVKSKMLVLDENGDVLMKLIGGERIISRKETVQLIKKSLRAYKTDDISDYKKVGKLLFKIIEKQDNREPEYVSKP